MRRISASEFIQAQGLKKLFFSLAAALASTILLKLGPIQYLELLYAAGLLVLLRSFAQHGYRAIWFTPFLRIGLLWMVFLTTALVFAFASLRFEFYFPGPVGGLGRPVIITLARMTEVFTSLFFMLYLADEIRSRPHLARHTMRIYYWVGFASAIYSILSLPLNLAGIVDLGTFNLDHRMRGFYNEGGPYGLYLISVVLVGIALYNYGWEKRQTMLWSFLALAVAFLGSQSKAAILAALFLGTINIFLAGSYRQRILLIASGVALLVVAAQFVDLGRALRAYQETRATYERLSRAHEGDPNFVLGRVAGAFIVPRMVAEHPWTGIGWGNYGLLRNAPEYRGASAWADIPDDPGLGVLGTVADFGIPLLSYLLVCLFLPAAFAKFRRCPSYLVNLALLQPTVHLFGAQLNLTYPWIVSAFALGLCSSYKEDAPGHVLAPAHTDGPGQSFLVAGTP